MYNHFKYTEKLATQLAPIAHTDHQPRFFRATEQTEMVELNEKINKVKGMIMVAIDGSTLDIRLNNTDSLMERPGYSLIIAKQTKSTDTNTIFEAQNESKAVMKEVIARMLHDYNNYKDNCDKIDTSSFQMSGFGPIGDMFYGVILDFYLDEGTSFKINTAMWL